MALSQTIDYTNMVSFTAQQHPNNLEQSAGGVASALAPSNPVLSNVLAQNFDPGLVGAATALNAASDLIVGAKIAITDPILTSNFLMNVTALGTVTHAYGLLVDVNGNICLATADFGGTWATGLNNPAWASGSFLVAGSTSAVVKAGLYYLAYALEQSAEPSTVAVTPTAGAANINMPAGTGRYVTMGSLVTGALPAGPLTLTNATTDVVPWMAMD